METKENESKSFCFYFATWFKVGLLKPIPPFKSMAGTYGSLFALPLCYLALLYVNLLDTKTDVEKIIAYGILLLFFLYLGVIAIPLAEKDLGPQIDQKGKIKKRDQNQIVVDEVFGMLVSCTPILFVPSMLVIHFIFAFVLFRFFDLTKIFPASLFDKIKNPLGVMLDDLVAGIYTAASLAALILYVL